MHAAPSNPTSLSLSSTRSTTGKSKCSTSLLVPVSQLASQPNRFRPSVCQAGTVTQSPTILMEINHSTTRSLPLLLDRHCGKAMFLELAIDLARVLSSSHETVVRRRRRLLVYRNGTSSPQWAQMVHVVFMSIWVSQALFSLKPMSKSGDWRRVLEHSLLHLHMAVSEGASCSRLAVGHLIRDKAPHQIKGQQPQTAEDRVGIARGEPEVHLEAPSPSSHPRSETNLSARLHPSAQEKTIRATGFSVDCNWLPPVPALDPRDLVSIPVTPRNRPFATPIPRHPEPP